MNHATLVEVLRPQPPVSISIYNPTLLVCDSLANNVVDSAAAKVRDL